MTPDCQDKKIQNLQQQKKQIHIFVILIISFSGNLSLVQGQIETQVMDNKIPRLFSKQQVENNYLHDKKYRGISENI